MHRVCTIEEVGAILEAPRPQNVKEIQTFLGFVNDLSEFFPSVSLVLNPLYKVLKKRKFGIFKKVVRNN